MSLKDILPAHDKSETQEIEAKPWNLADEYRSALKKPEGDPWRVVLDPLHEDDQIRCEGWKDEIGNLLIFAGLFSAVVTAFIIESSKSLLPDANDDIISLLSQIATHLQSYPGKSTRETLTMYRMRSEGLERWYVWKILVALPLLLQVAFVLFFAGVVDFLIRLDNTALVVSVSVVIGLILVFLVATTTLPALQVLGLYIRSIFSPNISSPPSQCPYKSPQAHVFCAMCDISFRLPRSIFAGIWLRLYDLCWKHELTRTRELLDDYSFFTPFSIPRARLHLSTLWSRRTWTDFDLGWLWLRDACSRGAHDKDFDLFSDQQEDNTHVMPLFDCIGAIREHLWNMSGDGYGPNLVNDAYHCFVDISETFTINEISSHYWVDHLRDLVRRNEYLRFSVGGSTVISGDCSAFDHLTLEKDADAHEAIKILHDRNLFVFLEKLQDDFPTRDMKARIQQYMFGRRTGLLPDTAFPLDLELFRERSIPVTDHRQVALTFQYMNVIESFFSYTSDPSTTFSQEDLYLHRRISESLHQASDQICGMISLIRGEYDDDTYSRVPNAYTDLLDLISTSLLSRIASNPTENAQDMGNTTKLSYFAAIYTELVECAFRARETDIPDPQAHARLLAAILKVKALTIDRQGGDLEIEARFGTKAYEGRIIDALRFTPEWWAFLGINRRDDSELAKAPSIQIFTQTAVESG